MLLYQFFRYDKNLGQINPYLVFRDMQFFWWVSVTKGKKHQHLYILYLDVLETHKSMGSKWTNERCLQQP